MAWSDFKGKKVFVQVDTTNGLWTYSGICDDVIYTGKNIEGVDVYFLEIIDIKGKKAGFVNTNIKLIKEEK
jgi:hypothetical protein